MQLYWVSKETNIGRKGQHVRDRENDRLKIGNWHDEDIRWKSGGDIKMNETRGRLDGKQHGKRGKKDEGGLIIAE